jgi:hypothetical protein
MRGIEEDGNDERLYLDTDTVVDCNQAVRVHHNTANYYGRETMSWRCFPSFRVFFCRGSRRLIGGAQYYSLQASKLASSTKDDKTFSNYGYFWLRKALSIRAATATTVFDIESSRGQNTRCHITTLLSFV